MQSSHAAIMQSANLFVFVMNNPVRWLDPSGLRAVDYTLNLIDGGGSRAYVSRGTRPASTPSRSQTQPQPEPAPQPETRSNARATFDIFIRPILTFIPDTVYAIINSVSIGIEYGVGIGANVEVFGLQGRVDPIVVRNTTSFSMQGVSHGDWGLYTGLFVGPQGWPMYIGGYTRMAASHTASVLGVHTPFFKLGWDTRDVVDFKPSVGISAYFGIGGGINISFDWRACPVHFTNSSRRW